MLVFFTATLPHFWVILSISSLPFPIEDGLSFQPLSLYTRIPPNTIFPRSQVDGGTKEESLTLTFSPAFFFFYFESLLGFSVRNDSSDWGILLFTTTVLSFDQLKGYLRMMYDHWSYALIYLW